MAKINSGDSGSDGNGGNGDGCNERAQPRNMAETSGPQIGNQTVEGASVSADAEASSIGDGNGSHAVEVGDGGDRRTSVGQGRALAMVGPEGPWVRHLDFRSGVEALVVIGESSTGASGSGSGSGSGGDGGDVQTGPSQRDPTREKGVVTVEESSREASVERPEFVLAAGSSRHEPISKSDFAEFMGDDVLAQLWAENPTVVAAVLAAREERLRQIGLAKEEEQLR